MRSLTHLLRKLRRPPKPTLHPFDQAHGTDTSGLIPPSHLLTGHPSSPHTTAYYAMSPSRLRAAIDLWQSSHPLHPIHRTTFVDLGCGKGRAVLLASELPFAAVLGVELHPRLARIARQNLSLWRRKHPGTRPLTLLEGDASETPLPTGPTLLYLFHPFNSPVTHRLLHHIRAHPPVSLDILYFNPEAADLWLAQPEVRLLASAILDMSPVDAAADPIANPDDLCHLYRWTPLPSEPPEVPPAPLPQHSH